MKYFLHDTNSFDDEKITELFLKYGYEGLGLFYTALEKIGKQEKPIKTTVLKAQLKVGKRLEKCWLFMEQIGLLSSNNGDTFNKQLLNFSEKYQIKKEKTREKVLQWRKKQEDKENVTSYVPICNPPKVKESKVKGNKEDKEYIYNDFYDSEIQKSDNDENYIKTVKAIFGENNLKIPLTVLLKMESQLSYSQFQKIWYVKQKYGFSIISILESMHNWGNPKKYKTIYGTFQVFAKNDNPKVSWK